MLSDGGDDGDECVGDDEDGEGIVGDLGDVGLDLFDEGGD